MKLPNLSYMMRLGHLRFIQAEYERGEYRNPDLMVPELLTSTERWACRLRGRFFLNHMRSHPFYRYVCARTKHYDLVFTDAIGSGFQNIVNIGCGSDTRAYRFAHLLKQKGMRVLECDQPEAISVKQRLLTNLWPTDHIRYLAVDLNEPGVPELRSLLDGFRSGRTLVMLEGVSPYVEESSWDAFVAAVAGSLTPGSELAYDFKKPDVALGFGTSARTKTAFRLTDSLDAATAFHARHGLSLAHHETSAAMTARLVPDQRNNASPVFSEDVLVRLIVGG